MAEPAAARRIRVTVAWSPAPREVIEKQLDLPEGATAQAALDCLADLPAGAELGIWGRKVDSSQPLRDGDRLELYRPLKADPKVARRERFSRQGARATGLFARRRPGAKPGY